MTRKFTTDRYYTVGAMFEMRIDETQRKYSVHLVPSINPDTLGYIPQDAGRALDIETARLESAGYTEYK